MTNFRVNLIDADGVSFAGYRHALELEITPNGCACDVVLTAWSGGRSFCFDVVRGVEPRSALAKVEEIKRSNPAFFGDKVEL